MVGMPIFFIVSSCPLLQGSLFSFRALKEMYLPLEGCAVELRWPHYSPFLLKAPPLFLLIPPRGSLSSGTSSISPSISSDFSHSPPPHSPTFMISRLFPQTSIVYFLYVFTSPDSGLHTALFLPPQPPTPPSSFSGAGDQNLKTANAFSSCLSPLPDSLGKFPFLSRVNRHKSISSHPASGPLHLFLTT